MKQILVVDPSLLDRQRMAIALEAVGYRVLEADCPSDALAQLRAMHNSTVSMVITELHFPDDSGINLVRTLLSDPAFGGIPVLVVTMQPPREQVIELVAAGVSTIISKPFRAELLLRRVTETLTEVGASEREVERVSWSLVDYLRRELKRTSRNRSHLSLLVVQMLNPAAEALVPAVMHGLIRSLRETDLVVRTGPRQVSILLPDADGDGAAIVQRRICGVLNEVAEAHPGWLSCRESVQIGMAVFPTEAADADSLLALARERAEPTVQTV